MSASQPLVCAQKILREEIAPLVASSTPCYDVASQPVSVHDLAAMLAAFGRAALQQIDPTRTGGSDSWMRVPPGGHLLGWVFEQFEALYLNSVAAEVAMRHSIASFMHEDGDLTWWPFNTMTAWRGVGLTKLLEVQAHGEMETPAPATAVVDRCASSLMSRLVLS